MLVIVGIVVPGSALGVREHRDRPTASRRGCGSSRSSSSSAACRPRSAPIIAVIGVGLFVGGVLVEGGDHDRERPDQVDRPGQPGRPGHREARGRDRLLEHARDPGRGQQRLRPAGDRPDLGLHARRRGARRGRHVVEPRQHDGQDPDGPGSDRRSRPSEADIYERVGGDAARTSPAAACTSNDDVPTATQINLRLAPASLEERAVLVESLAADLQRRIDALDLDADEHPARGPARGPGSGAGRARRPRHGRHRAAREPVGEPRRAHLPRARASPGCTSCCALRSLGRALLALVPVFLAIGVVVARGRLLDITLSPLTTVSGRSWSPASPSSRC